jgi:hypothetical protein
MDTARSTVVSVAAGTSARRADAGDVRLGGRDVAGLLLVGDMYGAPYDMLAGFLGVRPDRLRGVVARWRRAGYAATGRLGPGPGWCWLTRAGLASPGSVTRRPARHCPGWRTSAPCWPSACPCRPVTPSGMGGRCTWPGARCKPAGCEAARWPWLHLSAVMPSRLRGNKSQGNRLRPRLDLVPVRDSKASLADPMCALARRSDVRSAVEHPRAVLAVGSSTYHDCCAEPSWELSAEPGELGATGSAARGIGRLGQREAHRDIEPARVSRAKRQRGRRPTASGGTCGPVFATVMAARPASVSVATSTRPPGTL